MLTRSMHHDDWAPVALGMGPLGEDDDGYVELLADLVEIQRQPRRPRRREATVDWLIRSTRFPGQREDAYAQLAAREPDDDDPEGGGFRELMTKSRQQALVETLLESGDMDLADRLVEILDPPVDARLTARDRGGERHLHS